MKFMVAQHAEILTQINAFTAGPSRI